MSKYVSKYMMVTVYELCRLTENELKAVFAQDLRPASLDGGSRAPARR